MLGDQGPRKSFGVIYLHHDSIRWPAQAGSRSNTMTARATALALALVLLAAGASAAQDACCPPIGSAEPTIRSSDCCESMLEAAALPQAALATAVRDFRPSLTDHALPVDPLSVSGLSRLSAAQPALEKLPDGPPLYRLHSQLLI
jgi:hypothetical protein